MEKSELKLGERKTPTGWGKRHTFAVLGFIGFAISYGIRFNISIAIVAMVNSTAVSHASSESGADNYSSRICTLDLPPVLPTELMSSGASVFNRTVTPYLKPLEEEEGEFNWNEEMQGYILGSFFWGYMLTQLPAGVISQRYGGKWCFGIGIFVPGLLALLTPVSARMGSGWLMAVRVGQGLGGGLTMSAAHGLLARWVPLEERGTLSPFIYAGMSFGSAITMLVSGYLAHYFGWAIVFYTTGIVAIIWSVFWAFFVYESPSAHPTISKEELKYIGSGEHHESEERVPTPWKEIWTSVPFWAIIIAHAAETWGLYTLMTEIPTYLKTVLNFDMKQNSWISAFPYLLTWIFSILISYLGNFLLRKKLASTAFVRKLANSIALWGAGACMIGIAYSGCNRVLAVTFLAAALGTLGGFYSGVLCNHIDIAPRFASILMGITNTAATSPGFLAPLVAGNILKGNPSLEQWRKVFLLGATITFAGNLFFVLFAQGTEQKWNSPTPTPNKRMTRTGILMQKLVCTSKPFQMTDNRNSLL